MPLPLFFIVAAAGSAVVGAGKTIKAGIDNKSANDYNASANELIDEAKDRIENARKMSGKSLKNLGNMKLNILNGSIKDFLDSFEKIKNVNFNESDGLNEMKKLHIDKQTFAELREMGNFASSMLSGSVAGAASGAAVAFGAYSAATTFAAASTGTAIASLSGAAATNATLAFFGGGSLAAGGLGIAGGTAVLGGLVAGPALLVMGLVTGAKASKKLDDAMSNYSEAQKIAEELNLASDQCINIARRSVMFYSMLARFDSMFLPLIVNMEHIIENEGIDYKDYTQDSKKQIAACASLAGSIKAILDTAILTEDGNLTDESKQIAVSMYDSINAKEV